MIMRKGAGRSRTIWMLALHLIAQACAFFGLDVDLSQFAGAADDGLTVMEVAEVLTVLLAVYFRFRATHTLTL